MVSNSELEVKGRERQRDLLALTQAAFQLWWPLGALLGVVAVIVWSVPFGLWVVARARAAWMRRRAGR